MQKTMISEKILKFYLQTSWPLADTTAIFASMVYLESPLEILIKDVKKQCWPFLQTEALALHRSLSVNKDSVDIQSGYFSIKMEDFYTGQIQHGSYI